jgi:hypothetical protein
MTSSSSSEDDRPSRLAKSSESNRYRSVRTILGKKSKGELRAKRKDQRRQSRKRSEARQGRRVQTVEHSELSWACRPVQISESVERNRGCRSARKGACPILDGDETTIINPNDFGIRFPEGTNETPSSLREYENQAHGQPVDPRYVSLRISTFDDRPIRPLIVPRPIPLGRLAPWRLRDPPLALPPAATVGVIDGVHGHTSDHRPPSQPSRRSSFAQLSVFMLWIR